MWTGVEPAQLRVAALARRAQISAKTAPGLSDQYIAIHASISYGEAMTETQHEVHEHPDHTHGPDCGHEQVEHGDHVDYLHDGHRHAAHGDHYDEH